MGGGSAQVRPPYQVSVADGLSARLGDRVTVVDGVEVRTRRVPARRGFVTDPVTGRRACGSRLYDAVGAVLRRRRAPRATTIVRPRRRLRGTEPVARGRALGDRARRRAADRRARRRRLDAAGRRLVELGVTAVTTDDFGEEILRPPGWQTDVVARRAPTELVAEVAPDRARAATARSAWSPSRPAARRRRHRGRGRRGRARPTSRSSWSGSPRSRRPRRSTSPRCACPAGRTSWSSAVAAAARRTVVVVNAATPVLMPWLDEVDAVLWAGLPGQEGGHAVAAALLGDIEPAGRLVTTFPAADGADAGVGGRPRRTACWPTTRAPFIGYRGHAAGRAPEPAFWFGHGLGYGAWEYGAGHGHGPHGRRSTVTQHLGRRLSARSCRSTSTRTERDSRSAWSAGRPRRRPARRRRSRSPATSGCGGRGTPLPGPGTTCRAEELVVARGLGDVRQRIPLD